MNRRRRGLELLGSSSVFNHADNVLCHHTSLLCTGSGGLVRSSIGDVTERENIGEFLALELQSRFHEDATVGRVHKRCTRFLRELCDQAVVGLLSCSHNDHVCSQGVAIGELDLDLLAIIWNTAGWYLYPVTCDEPVEQSSVHAYNLEPP